MSDAPEEIIELAEADRVAAPLLLRMGNGCRAPDRAGLPYACSYRSASRDRDLIRDADMAREHAAPADDAVLPDIDAACHDCRAGHGRAIADVIVVGNLAEVVDDDVALNDSVIYGSPVNAGVCPDLNPVADGDGAQLRDLDPLAALVGVAEAVRADYRAGLEQAVRSDPDIVFPIKQFAPMETLSPISAPSSITVPGPTETPFPSLAEGEITARSEIPSAGSGVVSRI